MIMHPVYVMWLISIICFFGVVSTSDVLFVCDFEDNDCDIQQDKSDSNYTYWSTRYNWDWKRKSGHTPTYYTGPNSGYDGSRYYLYANAARPSRYNYARVIINKTDEYKGLVCIKFAYHMYGSGMGTLIFGQGVPGTRKVLWKLSGNQKNIWHTKTVCTSLHQSEEISWKAVRGHYRSSDIAIDNIKLVKGLRFCDFTKKMCGFQQDEDDSLCEDECEGKRTYDWKFKVDVADPYLYIKLNELPKDRYASISSSLDKYTGPACVDFRYSMYYYYYRDPDKPHGIFEMIYENTDHNASIVIWEKQGDQKKQWFEDPITVVLTGHDKLIWKATSEGTESTTARIDSIAILKGPCEVDLTSLVIVDVDKTSSFGQAGYITYDLIKVIPEENVTVITCNITSDWAHSGGLSLEALELNMCPGDEYMVYNRNSEIVLQHFTNNEEVCNKTRHSEVLSLFTDNVDISFAIRFGGGEPQGRNVNVRYAALFEVTVHCVRTHQLSTDTMITTTQSDNVTYDSTDALANRSNISGTIIGIVVGILAGLIISCAVLAVIFILRKRKKQPKQSEDHIYENENYHGNDGIALNHGDEQETVNPSPVEYAVVNKQPQSRKTEPDEYAVPKKKKVPTATLR